LTPSLARSVEGLKHPQNGPIMTNTDQSLLDLGTVSDRRHLIVMNLTSESLRLAPVALVLESQVPCHHVSQPLRHDLGMSSIVGLDHDPHQGLGAGLAQEHPAHPGQLDLGCTNL
jgi:hypothetical protein